MEKLKPPSTSQREKDKNLEQNILSLQDAVLDLIQVLDDYSNMNLDMSSHTCIVRRNREEFFQVLKKDIERILGFLYKISEYYCKKKYTDCHLANMIFLPKQQYKDYFSCNIQAIIKSIGRYRDHILRLETDSEFENNHYLRGLCTFFQEMLTDISEFNDEMYRYKASYFLELKRRKMISEDNELFVQKYRTKACRRTQLMAMEILHASQQIVSRFLYYNDISPVPVAIFQLRQAIEIRMLEILRIASIIDENGLPKKITGNTFFGLPGLEDSIVFPVKFSNIKKIYAWTNFYVHMAICNNYWLLDFAQDYLGAFVCCQPIIKESFFNNLKKNIAAYTHTEEKNIIPRERIEATIINDDEEFQKIKSFIEEKGFAAYLKKRDNDEWQAMLSYTQQSPTTSTAK